MYMHIYVHVRLETDPQEFPNNWKFNHKGMNISNCVGFQMRWNLRKFFLGIAIFAFFIIFSNNRKCLFGVDLGVFPKTKIYLPNYQKALLIERLRKPNFGSIWRYSTVTGLEVKNRSRTVGKFRSIWTQTESNFRFKFRSITDFRSPALVSGVRRILS